MKKKYNNYTIEFHTNSGDVIDVPQTRLHKCLSKIYLSDWWNYHKIILKEATYGQLLEVDNKGNVYNNVSQDRKMMNLKSRHIGRVETYKCWRKK
jgi:hypothetical protein